MGAEARRGEIASRRRLLIAAGTGVLALAGCGGSASRTPTNPEFRGADADVLDGLLILKNRTTAAYVHASRLLTGAQRALARRLGVQEAAHVYALTGAVDRLAGVPTPPAGSYDFGATRTGPQALRLAAEIEDLAIAACIDAMPKLSDLEARATVVSIATCDAQHAALVAQARGLPPAPLAIVRGRA